MMMLGNFISEMHGADFIPFYIILGIGALILTGVFRSVVRTRSGEEMRCTTTIDPYHIAWLRGGEQAMALTAACHLMSKGLIEPYGVNFITMVPADQRPREVIELDSVERVVWNRIRKRANDRGSERVPISGIFENDLDEPLKTQADRAELWALENGLIMGRFENLLVWVPFILWACIGLYKLGLGISNDRPVGFLVILLAVGGILGGIWISSMPKRTRRGTKYMNDLQTLAEGYSTNVKAETPLIAASHGGADPAFIFAVAALGTGFLAGTQMDLFGSKLPSTMKAAASSNGVCGGSSCSVSSCSGSSCSVSSCGGGGCGGGCGGCGGD